LTSKVKVVNKLPDFVRDRQYVAARAVTKALVLGASEASTLTPVKSSNLLNSQFRSVELDGTKVVGTVGYTAAYALAVHEASGKLKGRPRPLENGKPQGVYWGPGGEPNYLKMGFEKAKANIDAVITGALKA
jgi:hypothetical protein